MEDTVQLAYGDRGDHEIETGPLRINRTICDIPAVPTVSERWWNSVHH